MPEKIVVENSAHPSALGDTIASFPALKAYAWRAESPIEVYLAAAPARAFLKHPKIVLLEERPDNARVLDIQKFAGLYCNTGVSMVQAYLSQLGLKDLEANHINPDIDIDWDTVSPFLPYYDILIAPFSHSDYGTNTKVWPEEKWNDLFWFLNNNKKLLRISSIALLGTKADLTKFWMDLPINHVIDYPLPTVAALVSDANLTISIDTGISWIAQAVTAKHLVLLPATAHPGWAGNRNANAINMPLASEASSVMTQVKNYLLNLKV